MANLLARFKSIQPLPLYATNPGLGGNKTTSNTGMDTNNINDTFKDGKYSSYPAFSGITSRINDNTPKTYLSDPSY